MAERKRTDDRRRSDDRRRAPRAPENENAENILEGRNALSEALSSGRTVDKVFIAEGSTDRALARLAALAKQAGAVVVETDRRKLDQMSATGAHQGVIAQVAAHDYATIDDMFARAESSGRPPLIVLCDELSDPHNLGAIIRTANLAGAHGVIIPKRRAVGLTSTVAKTSAGAINYTPVAKVTNIAKTIEELKEKGIWFVCADMGGETMYDLDLTGPMGLVIGNEGEGVSRLVREACDFTASIPMKGDIDSLNASVAAGVLAYEIVRQRLVKAAK